jgi:hypothetical protein
MGWKGKWHTWGEEKYTQDIVEKPGEKVDVNRRTI